VPDVQDALVSILSDKNISIPELPDANTVLAKPGFNIIATANSRDQGVNDLSAALKRRFNYVHIPIVADKKTEIEIVRKRSTDLLEKFNIPATIEPALLDLLATVFRELREGKTSEGIGVKAPGTTLSTAEAIGTAVDAVLHSRYFGDGKVTAGAIARNLVGSIVKEDPQDLAALKEYVTIVCKKRGAGDKQWQAFHDEAIKTLK
jgi:MoxR-like ATPase